MKSAPEKFTGDHSYVRKFVEHYEQLCIHHNVTSDKEMVHSILQYCSIHVQEIIQAMRSYFTPNWSTFKSNLLKYFNADFSDQRFTETDLFRSVQQSVTTPITTLHGLRNYVREFIRIGGWLKNKEKISEREYNHYFWSGLPHGLQSDITNRLLLKNPTLDVSIPYDAEDVIKTAEELLCRDRFDLEDMEFLASRISVHKREDIPIPYHHHHPREDPIHPLQSSQDARATLKALDQEQATAKEKDGIETLILKL